MVADGNCLCMPKHPDCPICLGEQRKIDKCIEVKGSDMRKCLPAKQIETKRWILYFTNIIFDRCDHLEFY